MRHKWFPYKFINIYNNYRCNKYVQGTEKNEHPIMDMQSDRLLTTFYLN